ncbi:MAG: nuclear transport factor 2 family protein [Myxococcaceae bacterium]|nr:nuclear transport factor 2 family protein [Myxococcaceae bacterium]
MNADLARAWLQAFNQKNLDALLALYADDCRHTSPKIRALHPETGGQLRGKAALRAWWEDAFKRLPGLTYEETAVTAGERSVVLEYVRHVPNEAPMYVAEVFETDAAGKIAASRVYHG